MWGKPHPFSLLKVAKGLEEDMGLKLHVIEDIENSFLSEKTNSEDEAENRGQGPVRNDGKKTNSH